MRGLIKTVISPFKQDFVYIIGNYGLRIASFAFTILVAKKISPENYGLFGLATLIITYITYFNLGSQYSINKELSVNIANTKVNIYAIVNTIVFSLFVFVFVIIIKVFNLFHELHPFIYYLLIYPILFNLLEISNGILRAYNQSQQLGIIKLAGTFIVIIVTVYYLFVGVPDNPAPLFSRFLLFQAVEVAFALYFLFKIHPINFKAFKSQFDLKYLKYLIIQGLVLSLYITIDNFTKSIDRLFIAAFYSKTELGYYTFGVALQGPFLLAISSVMYMDFSRLLKSFRQSSVSEFNSIVKKTYRKLIILWVLTLFASIIVTYPLLRFYIPNYLPSYFVVIVYIFNFSIRILIFPYTSFLISNNYQLELIKVISIPSLFNIALSYLIVLQGLPYIFIIIVSFPSNIVYLIFLRSFFKRKILLQHTYKKNSNNNGIITEIDL